MNALSFFYENKTINQSVDGAVKGQQQQSPRE